jgi:hypothetical protein
MAMLTGAEFSSVPGSGMSDKNINPFVVMSTRGGTQRDVALFCPIAIVKFFSKVKQEAAHWMQAGPEPRNPISLDYAGEPSRFHLLRVMARNQSGQHKPPAYPKAGSEN